MDFSLAWENVSKAVGAVPLLRCCSGLLRSGEIVALMGLSGCGKTTLMKVLSGESSYSSGSVFVAGKHFNSVSRRLIGYVPQKGVFLDSLTVKEHLVFASLLRQPKNCTVAAKLEFVDEIMELLSLTTIANCTIRYLSGGEQRRCSIGSELLATPRILLLDEPVSGLDSAVAAQFLWSLRRLASGRGIEHAPPSSCTVYRSSIHQPSTGTFYSFDKLLLMSAGRVVYFGPPKKCLKYLSRVGFTLPQVLNEYGQQEQLAYNPADFVLELMFSTDPQEEGEQITGEPNVDGVSDATTDKSHLVCVHCGAAQEGLGMISSESSQSTSSSEDEQRSRFAARFIGWWPRYILTELYDDCSLLVEIEAEKERYEDSQTADQFITAAKYDRLSFIAEFSILLRRTMKTTARSSKLSHLAGVECTLIGLLAGFTWFQTKLSENSIVDTAGFLFFSVAFWFFSSVFDGVLEFLPERDVLLKDQASDAYRVSSYFAARTIGGLPSRLAFPVIYTVIAYPIAFSSSGYSDAPGFASWVGLMGVLVLTALAGEALGVLIGALCVQIDVCIAASTVVTLSMTIFGGFYIKELPFFMEPFQYFSVIKYGYDAAVQIKFSHPSNVNCDGGYVLRPCYLKESIENEEILEFLGADNLSLLSNVFALLAVYFVCRVVAFLFLVFSVVQNLG